MKAVNWKSIAVMTGILTVIIGIGGCSEGSGVSQVVEEAVIEETMVENAVTEDSAGETEREKEFGGAVSEKAFFQFKEQERIDEKLLEECEAFASLTEQYVENASFMPVENGQAEKLAELLSGHYQVAGRRADDGREYYMAVRRGDAPVYENFSTMSLSYVYHAGSVEGEYQIGYYDENGEETVLYQIPGYFIQLCKSGESEKGLDMFCLLPDRESDDWEFLYAFQESGRKKLEFIGKHSGLSYHEEGKNCIDFYYQDKDTLEFSSEPYSCCISLNDEESEKIKALLETGQDQKQEFGNHREAMEWLRKKESSVRTTGARLNLGSSVYEILGSRDSGGYLLGSEEDKACWLKREEPLCSYVLDRIEQAVGKDYGDFTDKWFDVELAKASLVFPRMEEGENGEWEQKISRQIITETEKLEQLSKLLGSAIRGNEALSGCPYVGVLDLEREDGETLQMFVAADSCDSITYDGRIGFEYGKQQELADIFDEAMR